MGNMTKLIDAASLPELGTNDDEIVWDADDCDWVPRHELARRRLVRERREQERRFRESGCAVTDAVHALLSTNSLGETAAIAALSAWSDDRHRKPWLALSGPPGCGKTVAVASLLWNMGGRFVRADELVRLFASMFGEQYERQQELRDAYKLMIDDIGGELDEKRMLPALLDLLDTRKSAHLQPTIFTTNLSKKDFAARYDNPRLMSRMAESVHWVALSGDDLRRAK